MSSRISTKTNCHRLNAEAGMRMQDFSIKSNFKETILLTKMFVLENIVIFHKDVFFMSIVHGFTILFLNHAYFFIHLKKSFK